MYRKLFVGLSIFFGITVYSQQLININQASSTESSQTLDYLVENLLISGACSNVSNFYSETYGLPSDLTSKSYGYFKKNPNSDFPFEEGIVMSTGRAYQGGNTYVSLASTNLSGASFSDSDADLENFLGLSPNSTFDKTFIEFDFVPRTDKISFRYIMASAEYNGSSECTYKDGFAFLLRPISSSTYVNLAVLPDLMPVNVMNINGADSQCSSHTEYFAGYRSLGTPLITDTNYGGRTIPLIATATVIPNQTYHIKLVLADETNAIYDTAIFFEAGSFNLGVDLGQDMTFSANNPVCGDTYTLDAGTYQGATYQWFFNGISIAGATSQTYTAESSNILGGLGNGNYGVEVAISSACTSSDDINIDFADFPVNTLSTSAPMYGCDTDGDGFYSFDLHLNDTNVLNGQDPTLFEVVYFATQSDRDNDIPITTNFTNANSYVSQTVYAQVRNILSATCYANTEFTINVLQQPIANPVQDMRLCDDSTVGNDTDGLQQFYLDLQTPIILGSQSASQFNITYHASQADADTKSNLLSLQYVNTTPFNQTIYARIENASHPDCFNTLSFNLVVLPLPTFVSSTVHLEQCDDDTDGFTYFNLYEANELISGNYQYESFTYYLHQNDALLQQDSISNPTSFLNLVQSHDVVWAVVTNTNGCSRIKEVNLEVVSTQIPLSFNFPISKCDDFEVDNDDTNGIVTFDLTTAKTQIESLFPNPQDLSILFYENISDALSESNAISDISNYRNENYPHHQFITVRVENKNFNTCIGLGEYVELTVLQSPQFEIVAPSYYCLNEGKVTLSATTDGQNYTYKWFDANDNLIGTNPTLDIYSGGTYRLELTLNNGCPKSKTVTILESQESLLTTTDLNYTQFQYDNTLTIPVGQQYGLGDYVYSLSPDGPFTDEPQFANLYGGNYVLYVQDLNGCKIHEVPFVILEYMRFFTPNNDGYNDYWNLLGATLDATAEINIFDRFGKHLAKIDPMGLGWDGTYNGQPMPASDYWFTIVLSDGTVYRSHFGLKR